VPARTIGVGGGLWFLVIGVLLFLRDVAGEGKRGRRQLNGLC
jgi:hypothetical protein